MSPRYVTGGIVLRGRMTPVEVLTELERQKASAQDYVLNTSDTRVVVHPLNGNLILEMNIDHDGNEDFETVRVPFNARSHAQMAQYVGIPMRSALYGKFKSGSSDNPGLYYNTWARTYNDVLRLEPKRRLFRTVEDSSGNRYLRAFLSKRYMIIDNLDMFFAVVDALEKVDAEIVHARLDDDHFHIYAVASGISAQVSSDRTFKDSSGKNVRWLGDLSDVYNAAVSISNSETGEGQCEIRPAIFRRVTQTYSVWDSVLSKRHVGGTNEADSVMLTDATRQKKNDAFYSEISDWVTGTFTTETLERYIRMIESAAVDEVNDSIAAVEALRIVYDISEERKNSIRNRFITHGDRTRYGLAQAVMVESSGDIIPSEGTHLERISAKIMESTTVSELESIGQKEIKTREDKAVTASAVSHSMDL